MIELVHLGKIFQTAAEPIVALEDVSLTIEDGEIFGIIGLSGAGKSTLVRCINLLERPTSGDVLLDGKSLLALPQKELLTVRRQIGMIFQSFNLFEQRTVLKNVCYPLEIAGVSKAEAVKKARKLLELVSLADREKAYPSQLSGGQKQRVAIARALATDPKYLLCDEATSALDPNTTQSILSLLKKINRELGVTIVVITHEMRVVDQICDRVAVIDKSRIAEIGRVSDIFSNPQSEIARELILPQSPLTKKKIGKERVRIIFDGTEAQPAIADMVLACQTPVSIIFADTKELDGKSYGHMIIQLPEDAMQAERITAWLNASGLKFTKEAQ